MDAYDGPDFEYLNDKGVIPPESVLPKKGAARRENQFKEFVPKRKGATEGDEDDEDEEKGLDLKSAEMEG